MALNVVWLPVLFSLLTRFKEQEKKSMTPLYVLKEKVQRIKKEHFKKYFHVSAKVKSVG